MQSPKTTSCYLLSVALMPSSGHVDLPRLRYKIRVAREEFFVGSSYNLSANGISTAWRDRVSRFAQGCHHDAPMRNTHVFYGCCGRGSTEEPSTDCDEHHVVELDYMRRIRKG